MYPALPTSFPPSQLSSGGPYPHGYASAPISGGNATAPSNSLHESHLTTSLRVRIAEAYRVDPPVKLPPTVTTSALNLRAFDFDYEKAVLAEEDPDSVDLFLSRQPSTHSYLDATTVNYINMGYPTGVVLLASTQPGYMDKQGKVVDFCTHYQDLISMGFRHAHVVGALMKADNNKEKALDLCLAVAS